MKSTVGVYKFDFENQKEVLIGHFSHHAFIGHSKSVDITIDDPKINGVHAMLERRNNQLHLVDLGSGFGTYHKNKRINEVIIEENEQFVMGKQALFLKSIENQTQIKNLKKTPKVTEAVAIKTESAVSAENDSHKILQVTLYWGEKILEMRSFDANADITIGKQKDSTFIMAFGEDLPGPFTLGHLKSRLLSLNLPVAASGVIWMNKQICSIDTLRHRNSQTEEFSPIEVYIGSEDKALIQFGELAFDFRFVTPAKPIPVNWLAEMDTTLVKITLCLLILLLFLFLYVQLTPRPPEPVKTLADIPQNLQRILFDSGIKNALKKEKAAIGQLAENLEGGRQSGDEGRSAGSAQQNATNAEANASKYMLFNLPKKERTIGLNKNQGVSDGKRTKLDVDLVFATNTKSAAIGDANIPSQGPGTPGTVVSKLVGDNYGKGTKGVGTGGGGTSVGIGQLKGNSTGGGMGHGDSGLIPSKGLEINSNSPGNGGNDIVVIGGLDSDIIAAIIKRYLPQIQNCYEQQLVVHPALRGKVTVAFTIGPDGSVKNQSIAESSLKNQPTEKCILEKIQNWKFPKPRGGGTVGVKYPFLLMSNRPR